MNEKLLSDKLELTELSNKLFMHTDARAWQQLLDEVFTENIWFDATSLGAGEPKLLIAKAVCDMWQQGFAGLDAIHHQGGQYVITINGDTADIYGYAVAFHFKQDAVKGNTRTFVGSYDLKAERTIKGWRLNQFKYNLKFIDGNKTLE